MYLDTHAAMEILKSVHKPLLTESPFVKYLFIGANNEGSWNSFHMSLQFEDVVDCLQVLYPEYDFVFVFDHKSGTWTNARWCTQRHAHVTKLWGCAAINERHDNIKENGFLGPYSPKLKVGTLNQ